MKASDVRAKTSDELKANLEELKKRTVQPAFPEGHRSARKHRSCPSGSPGHCADPDSTARQALV